MTGAGSFRKGEHHAVIAKVTIMIRSLFMSVSRHIFSIVNALIKYTCIA